MKQLLILGFIATLALTAFSFVAPESAAAKSVTCDEAGNCVVRCSQTLGNGTFIEYDEGTEITVTDNEGVVRKFKCVNGDWVLQANVGPGHNIFGNIAVASIGGIQGELTESCLDSICTSPKLPIGPRGLRKTPGCDPDVIFCP